MKIQDKDRQSSKKSSLRQSFLSSSFSPSLVSTFSSDFLFTQCSPKLYNCIKVPSYHLLSGTSFTCLVILARTLWQPRRANKTHRRRTERPRTHKKGKLEFEIMSSESSSLPTVTQELLLCSITSFQSDDRHRRGSYPSPLLLGNSHRLPGLKGSVQGHSESTHPLGALEVLLHALHASGLWK